MAINGSGVDIDIACDYARPTEGPTRRPYSGEGHFVRALSLRQASGESIRTHFPARLCWQIGQPAARC